MRCPNCGESPLEVYGNIDKTFEGVLDEDGNLETETDSEKVVKIDCRSCGYFLDLNLIKNWR